MKEIDREAMTKIIGIRNMALDRPFHVITKSEVEMYFNDYDQEEIIPLIQYVNPQHPVTVLDFNGISWLDLNVRLNCLKERLEDKFVFTGKSILDEMEIFYEKNADDCYYLEWDDEILEDLFGDCVNDEEEYRFIEAYIYDYVIKYFVYKGKIHVPEFSLGWKYVNDAIEQTIIKRCHRTDDYFDGDKDDISDNEFYKLIDKLTNIAKANRKEPNTISTRRIKFYCNRDLSPEQIDMISDALVMRGIKVNKTRNNPDYQNTRAFSEALEAADTDPYKYLN